ncbi:MAG TPA: radical SAM protein, partial [Verrucomicrobiae bacterium]|nr:radical SAM protein [Verrucomicrobiae bacterium]
FDHLYKMVCLEKNVLTSSIRGSRSAIARNRAAVSRAMLGDCHFCAHHCGVNRLQGQLGLCRANADTRFFLAQSEVTDELQLIPTFAIALSGCDLRCDFCITGKESWNPRMGQSFNARKMAVLAEAAVNNGARTIMVLGGEPTIHLHAALELASLLPDSARLVWKTNAHGSAQARELLDGIFDVWVADFKFGNDGCARRLAKVADYTQVVTENLIWANTHSELIVRHLLMPGHLQCCWKPVAEWLAENLPGVKVNLRAGFWPAWHSHRHEEFSGTDSANEAKQALRIGQLCGLSLVE